MQGKDTVAKAITGDGEQYPYEISAVWSVNTKSDLWSLVEVPEYRVECEGECLGTGH